MTDIDSEPELVDAAVAGDVHAFARLYDRYVDRVYRHVYYRVGNASDAEDLTQQVFLQAWQAIRRYRRTEAPFGAWLVAIAHNLVVSAYRQAKETGSLDGDVRLEAHWGNPEEETLAAQDRLAVARAIQRLKPEQQLVVLLRFVEHADYDVIAAVLGKSSGNVRVILHRALADLRRLLTHEVKP